MATGGKNVKSKYLEPLKGKVVYFYPDFDAGDAWGKFAELDPKWRVHQLAKDFGPFPKEVSDLADVF